MRSFIEDIPVLARKINKGGGDVFRAAMLWLCFKIPILSILQYQGHVRFESKSKICLFYLYATAKSEILICSNEHETCLVNQGSY